MLALITATCEMWLKRRCRYFTGTRTSTCRDSFLRYCSAYTDIVLIRQSSRETGPTTCNFQLPANNYREIYFKKTIKRTVQNWESARRRRVVHVTVQKHASFLTDSFRKTETNGIHSAETVQRRRKSPNLRSNIGALIWRHSWGHLDSTNIAELARTHIEPDGTETRAMIFQVRNQIA